MACFAIQIFIILLLNTTWRASCDRTSDKLNLKDVKRTSISTSSKYCMVAAEGKTDGALCNIQSGKESTGKGWRGSGAEFVGIRVHGNITTVSAQLAVFAPGEVKDGQYSSAFISVENGDGVTRNQIKVGWVVNPCYYKDNKVHFFTYYMGNNQANCWDNDCSDFIPLSKTNDLKFGDVLTPTEVGSGNSKYVEIVIGRVEVFGKWFVSANYNSVGYWQGEYFGPLGDGATTVRVGGEVYTPEGWNTSPPMGTGVFKAGRTTRTAFVQDVKINGNPPLNPETIESRCFFVADVGNPKWFQGFGFFFGGKGGKDRDQCVHL